MNDVQTITPLLTCDYVEGNPGSYRGIILFHGGDEPRRFYSRNYDADLREAISACHRDYGMDPVIQSPVWHYREDRDIRIETPDDAEAFYARLGIKWLSARRLKSPTIRYC